MTIALQWGRWRRALALAGATLLLHYVAGDWLGVGEGGPYRPSVPLPMTVELRAAAPAPPAAAPAPRATVEPSAAVPVRQVQSAPAARQPEAVASPSRYKASLPPSAELTFDLVRGDGEVVAATGEGTLDWDLRGDAYRLRHSAALTLPVMENLAELASEGRVGAAGIVPRTMTERRRERAHTATHFDERGNITFSAAQRAVPMEAGAQDKATVPMQLAGIARAGAAQLGPGVAILVGEERDALMYRFVVQGRERIETGLGWTATWRLSRVVAPGAYNARLDIWLAPGHDWYPVQLRSTEANGTVTTQTIRKIVVKNAGN